ncbi:MAG TPA: NADH-quinone oxidoreductase subunit M [Verrucomicrobiae bacterium]|jgi:NADH-quinone oxidoreductase subunit M|nr:NADH-quinone oxidoreductase subunit M [Verrucomicrobiae bacterium]
MSPLTLIFILPLAAALVILLIPRNFRFLIRCVALAGTFLSMLVAINMFLHFNSAPAIQGFRFVEQHIWAPGLGISYHVGVDGINLGLILMGAIVVFAATAISWSIKTREKEFYMLLLLMGGGILGAFASLDLFFFYFFHELALVPTFIMIGVWGKGDQKNYATFQITLYLSLGALLVLLGLIGIYLQLPAPQRTFDIVGLTQYFKANPMLLGPQRWIFPTLLFGFGVLVSLWPFHTWAPIGYGSAPAGTAMIHAGVLKKFGLYGLIRIALPMMPEAAQHWVRVLSLLCLGNILYCGLVAMRQRNLNLLIGNSSVAHMGFAFLGIASLSLIGITGTVVVMVAHGFLAALTFALSGYLRDEIHTLEIPQMGGLLRRLPFIGTAMIIAMLAGCGLPGFASFPGEALVLFGNWDRSALITGLAVWGALVIAGVYMLRAIRNIWHGEKEWSEIQDAPTLWRRFPYGLLLAGLILFGCFPRLLTDNIKTSVASVVQSVGVNPTESAAQISRIHSVESVVIAKQVFAQSEERGARISLADLHATNDEALAQKNQASTTDSTEWTRLKTGSQ